MELGLSRHNSNNSESEGFDSGKTILRKKSSLADLWNSPSEEVVAATPPPRSEALKLEKRSTGRQTKSTGNYEKNVEENRTLTRVASDDSLLSAKNLIRSMISAQEKKERRLTAKLQKVEAEIRQSIGGVPSKSGLIIEPGHITTLEREHLELKKEHSLLEDEISKMGKNLSWIESKLEATQGHARYLSKSTCDWAGMMKQMSFSSARLEQSRTFRQGAMINKHSLKKRGCGPRFIAFRELHGELVWSKTILGAREISRTVNDEETSRFSANKQVNSSSIGNFVSFCVLTPSSMISYGDISGLELPKSCQNVDMECLVYVLESANSNPLLFEFFCKDLASSFANGLNNYVNNLLLHGEKENDSAMNSSFASLPRLGSMTEFRDEDAYRSSKSLSMRSIISAGSESRATETGFDASTHLYRELSVTKTKNEYTRVLNMCGEVVLPLGNTSDQRHGSADMTQVYKDLSRESEMIVNSTSYKLGSQENIDQMIEVVRRLLGETLSIDGAVEHATLMKWESELLLACSRTVIEGDIFSLCHRLLAVPTGRVVLCPGDPKPISVYLGSDGMVTIVVETMYRIVGVTEDITDSRPSLLEWGRVKVLCTEHLKLQIQSTVHEDSSVTEQNIRHIKLNFL